MPWSKPRRKLLLKRTRKPGATALPVLCVPSSFCLRCPIAERELVCFFKRAKPAA